MNTTISLIYLISADISKYKWDFKCQRDSHCDLCVLRLHLTRGKLWPSYPFSYVMNTIILMRNSLRYLRVGTRHQHCFTILIESVLWLGSVIIKLQRKLLVAVALAFEKSPIHCKGSASSYFNEITLNGRKILRKKSVQFLQAKNIVKHITIQYKHFYFPFILA